MKSTFLNVFIVIHICLLPVALSSAALPHQETVSLSIENQPLRSVLREIAEQTTVRFIYHDDLVTDLRVAGRLREASLDEAMTLVLEGTDLDYQNVSANTVVLFRKASEPVAFSTRSIQHETPPRLLYEIEPDYPRIARIAGLEGNVVVNCLVSGMGTIEETEVIQSSGHSSLDAAAQTFARRLEFEPARQGNDTVDVWLSFEVNFELDSRRISPNVYLSRIMELREGLASCAVSARDSLLHELLVVHRDFVVSTLRSAWNYNAVLGQILHPAVKDPWIELWDVRPLHFLVFHDYIVRFPESPEASDAEISLLYHLQRDIHRYLEALDQQNAGEDERLFLRLAHRLIVEHYPQALSLELEEAVQAMAMGSNI